MVEELLGEMERWRRYMSWMEELLRGWSVGERRESQEERKKSRKDGDGKHEETEKKMDEELREERQKRKMENRSGWENRK